MVPTIVIAHKFCASRDTQISYGLMLIIQGYFCAVQNYAKKAELSNCSWYPQRKLGVTMQFSEITKLQFGKERHTLLCISKLLQVLLINYLLKMHGYPQFSFWISITLVQICFSRIFRKPRKNTCTFELVGTILNQLSVLACFPSLPAIFWGKYTYHTLVFLSDVLTGSWKVDCGSVAMVTSLLPRRVLLPLLLP